MPSVPRPRIEAVRRFAAGHASAGDEAVVRVGPGLLALLENPIAGGRAALGAGYHARYNVPLGLAISAALAVVEPATPAGSWWVGREATVQWLALPALDDALVGEARLATLSERDALFTITARSDGGAELLRGQFLLVRVTGGHSVGYPSTGGSSAPASLEQRASARRVAPGPSAVDESTPGLRLRAAPTRLPLGRTADVIVELTGSPAAATWEVTARGPAARGLSVEPPDVRTLALEPGASASATFTVRADRPDLVNGGEPWAVDVRATSGAQEHALTIRIAVSDSRPPHDGDPLDRRDATTSELVAWTAPEPCAADPDRHGLRFPVRLLGRGIRVDADHPADVTVTLPDGLDAAEIEASKVVQGERVLGGGTTTVAVTLTDRETPIELHVALTAAGASRAAARFAAAGVPPLRERAELGQPDLFRLRPPSARGTAGCYRVPPDLVRLLMNPLAGHGEPLGRRIHPLAGLGLGASLTAAFGVAGDSTPAEPTRARAAALWIRWLAPPDLDADLEARPHAPSAAEGAHTVAVEVVNGNGQRTSQSEIVLTDSWTEARAASAALLARRTIVRAPATPPASAGPPPRTASRLSGLWRRLRASGP